MSSSRRLPIPHRALVLMVATLTFSMLFAALLSRWVSNTAKQDILDTYQQALTQATVTLNDRMETIRAASALVSRDVRLLHALDHTRAETHFASQLKDIRPLREMIGHLLLRKDILNVRLYLPDVHALSRERVHFFPLSQIKTLEDYEQLDASHCMETWVGQHPIRKENTWHQAISLIRIIRSDTHFDEIQAVLVLDVPAKHFIEVLDSLAGSGDDAHSLLLLDDQGQLVASVGAEQAKTAFLVQGKISQEDTSKTMQGYHILWAPLAHAPWQIVAVLSGTKLLKGHLLINFVTPFLVAVVLLVSLWIISIIFFTTNNRMVRNIIQDMTAELTESGIVAQDKLGTQQDVYQLRDSVRHLMNQATSLVEDACTARVRERNAALRALQAQINPHFLYNALDTVYWQALEDGAQSAASTIKHLANYFRISLSSGRDIISIEEELRMIHAYVDILKERYGHSFTFEIKAEPKTNPLLIPKFTIQPVVENAFLHGINRRRDPLGGRVTVEVKQDGSVLNIIITDNGPGFALVPEHKNGNNTVSGYQKNHGFGLSNVRNRLNFFTDGQYTMITRRQNGLTQVQINLPADIKPLNIHQKIEE